LLNVDSNNVFIVKDVKKHNHSTNGLTNCCAIDVIEYARPALKKYLLGPPEIRLKIKKMEDELVAGSMD
jgi:hypothetical protein